ncbi:MAG: metallophosphoesterase [Candidatus Coatesbacteria bacterium RBG_13_66_14]|uniref:Metallophosphoesterase n=1 Tax=Candidatus Coatesbacteria bacterium RBG_13_66_14 TaxID=1817816 RepID=A0A1F5FBA5_9BACT|nr:MAG: metallophosphoesterase [Candidatus Coatesbacteria bacterium RBG_13_66_14]
MGRPGRLALKTHLPEILAAFSPDLVIANAENAAGGAGISPKPLNELKGLGIDVFTSGNHVWDNREAYPLLEAEPFLLRPANYPPGVPGRGVVVRSLGEGGAKTERSELCHGQIGVINLQGRVFMREIDCPFRAADMEIETLNDSGVKVILVDFHAEATSEKEAMGRYLDGRVTAVIGTHTHVQTADGRVLPGGTAYLSDAGMCGPTGGVIGVKAESVVGRFLNALPFRAEPAEGPVALRGCVVDFDEKTGRALAIETVNREDDDG